MPETFKPCVIFLACMIHPLTPKSQKISKENTQLCIKLFDNSSQQEDMRLAKQVLSEHKISPIQLVGVG